MQLGRVTINFNSFEGSDIGNGIRDALAEPGLGGRYLRDFVSDLPRSIRGIELIEDTSIRSWQTHIANGNVNIKINPNSPVNSLSPGSIFHHEIAHKVGYIDDTAEIRANEYISNNPSAFAGLVSVAGSEEFARRAVQYGFEENIIQTWTNGYRQAAGEKARAVTAPTEAMKAYLEYLGYATPAQLSTIDLPESIFDQTAFDPISDCFLYDTQIQMWPLDPSIKPRPDGSYDEELVLSKVWHKQQNQMQVNDWVVSHDKLGRMQPGRVSRTMTNTATHILDFWDTGVTPGHAYYCFDGPFKDGYAPIMDILRTDTAVKRSDGTTFRAATNCDVGSIGDRMIHAAATFKKPDGSWTKPKPGQIRFGTRFSTPDGKKSTSAMEMAQSRGWELSDDGYMVAMIKGEDDITREEKFHFPYTHGADLPKPEEYILTRSQVTLEAIYQAAEWEQIGTRMPAPAGMEGLNTNHTSTLLKPSKPQPNIPPAFANRPDVPTVESRAQHPAKPSHSPSMNRKQRKAMEAKQRKAAKTRNRVVNCQSQSKKGPDRGVKLVH